MRHIYLLLACTVGFTACKSTANKTASTDDSLNKTAPAVAKLPTSTLNDAGTQTLIAVVNKYYKVKDALVASEGKQAAAPAQELVVVADSLDAIIKNDNANKALLPYADTVAAEAKKIANSAKDNTTTDNLQLSFSKASDNLYTLVQKAQLKNANIYQQHCPMALNEKGANWLSNESEIKNPYFGKKMLECGDITDSLK